MRYYIFDANGELFGNPKGYAKESSAWGIATRYRHKLWDIFHDRENKDSLRTYTIELM